MKKQYGWMSFFFIAVLASGCSKAPAAGTPLNELPVIQVQGNGHVETVPDEAAIRFGVTSDEVSLEKAYRDNTQKMNAVLQSLKKMRIAEKDIETSSYTVTPVYPKTDQGRILPGKPEMFTVRQELSVKVRDLAQTGKIIDEVIAKGTNQFNGLEFTSSKQAELETQAKEKAAGDARQNAELLAKSLGVKLGRLLRASTSSQPSYPRPMLMRAASASFMEAPSIQPGSLEVTASCQAEYEILQ